MNYYDPASYRSPETKTEVQQAAKLLIGLGALFVLGALLGIVMRLAGGDPDWVLVSVVLSGISPILLAAGAYNIYYTRRMRHHPLTAKALGNPLITVFVIMFVIFAVVFGGIGLLVYLK